jgi:hypothetical protein
MQISKKEQCTPSAYVQRGFYPYQLFGQGRYFGDTELFDNVERRSSVRCESAVGSLLVLHKRDLTRLLEDFPAFTPMWAVMAKRREIQRKKLLGRLIHGQKLKSFAATIILAFFRARKRSKVERVVSKTTESKISLTSESILQEPVTQVPATNARLILQPSRPLVHPQSRAVSAQDETVASLRADVDALREELRAGFRELQLCMQEAVRRHD